MIVELKCRAPDHVYRPRREEGREDEDAIEEERREMRGNVLEVFDSVLGRSHYATLAVGGNVAEC